MGFLISSHVEFGQTAGTTIFADDPMFDGFLVWGLVDVVRCFLHIYGIEKFHRANLFGSLLVQTGTMLGPL